MNDPKLVQAFALLDSAIEQSTADPDNAVLHAGVAKAFESTFEYVWKALKREADRAGLETYSPRDALKAAVQLKRIDDLELWNRFLNARNLSVHDYVGMETQEMVALVQQFRDRVRALLS